jgi:hypothetical protein
VKFGITTPILKVNALIFVLLFVSLGSVEAQEIEASSHPKVVKAVKSIALNAGTKGILGVDLGINLNPSFGLRVGFNYFDLMVEGYETNLNRFAYYADIDLTVKQSNIELLAEYAMNDGKFRVVTGFAFFFNNMLRGKVQLRDHFTLNDVDLTPEEIGYFQLTADFSSRISPYFGIGFGKLVPSDQINLSFDLGTYYKSKPLVEIDATNVIRNNDLNEDVVERNITQYRWWPVLSLRLAYKIN